MKYLNNNEFKEHLIDYDSKSGIVFLVKDHYFSLSKGYLLGNFLNIFSGKFNFSYVAWKTPRSNMGINFIINSHGKDNYNILSDIIEDVSDKYGHFLVIAKSQIPSVLLIKNGWEKNNNKYLKEIN